MTSKFGGIGGRLGPPFSNANIRECRDGTNSCEMAALLRHSVTLTSESAGSLAAAGAQFRSARHSVTLTSESAGAGASCLANAVADRHSVTLSSESAGGCIRCEGAREFSRHSVTLTSESAGSSTQSTLLGAENPPFSNANIRECRKRWRSATASAWRTAIQ